MLNDMCSMQYQIRRSRMAWEYDQSSGIIRLNGAYMGQGYAGTGGGSDESRPCRT